MELTKEQAKDFETYTVKEFCARKRPVPAYTSILYAISKGRLDFIKDDNGKTRVVMNEKGKRYRVNSYIMSE